MNKVMCNKCNKKFSMDIKIRILPLGVHEVYFICPYCKEKYVSYYTDAAIREKQKKINKMWEKYRNSKTPQETIRNMEAIEHMKDEIKADMEELKRKM